MKTLKNHLAIITVASFLMVTLFGCYKSKVPVSPPKMKIDKRILGKWYTTKNKKYQKKNTYYFITKLNARKYVIKKYTWNYSKKKYRKPTVYHGHLSKVRGKLFMNMKQLKSYEKKFGINLLTIHSKKNIEIIPLSGNIKEQFNSSKELKRFIKKYMHLSFFYEKNTSKLYR